MDGQAVDILFTARNIPNSIAIQYDVAIFIIIIPCSICSIQRYYRIRFHLRLMIGQTGGDCVFMVVTKFFIRIPFRSFCPNALSSTILINKQAVDSFDGIYRLLQNHSTDQYTFIDCNITIQSDYACQGAALSTANS